MSYNKIVKYPSKGIWSVSTEGDVEGRTVRNLGVYEGELDEIAFSLADQCYYSLQFKPSNPTPKIPDPKERHPVNVSLSIESGTWDLKGDALADYWRELLKGRDVTVENGQYYASVKLYPGRDAAKEAKREAEKVKAEMQNALNKLTPRERALLGLGGKNYE